MPISWMIVRAGFFDGLTAFFQMFRQVDVPGSALDELNKLADPEVLEEYRVTKPEVAAAILRAKDEAVAHRRLYNRVISVCGSIEIVATVSAIWYLAAHYRF
jgi:hypothetical protein